MNALLRFAPLTLAAALLAGAATSASAAPITTTTWDFTLTATAKSVVGSLGQEFIGTQATGSFSYDPSLIVNGNETLRGDEILLVFTVFGSTYDAQNDEDYPDYPRLEFAGGVPKILDFIATDGVNGVSFADTRLVAVRSNELVPVPGIRNGVAGAFTGPLYVAAGEIPAPQTLWLLGLGALALGRSRWRDVREA